MTMLIKVDFENDQPIYLQIRDQVIEGIASGLLKPGESLPSVRQLASDLDINLQTANKAYSILQGEGFLKVHRREGFLVRSLEEMRAGKDHILEIRERLRPMAAEAVCRGVSVEEFTGICTALFAGISKGEGTR
jgi:DNA-binding transcriptional regulator YhcF (GntR family)